jgi:hypothetical protein
MCSKVSFYIVNVNNFFFFSRSFIFVGGFQCNHFQHLILSTIQMFEIHVPKTFVCKILNGNLHWSYVFLDTIVFLQCVNPRLIIVNSMPWKVKSVDCY